MGQSTRLILVRHAQHDVSVEDGRLTAVGDEQARALAQAIHLSEGDTLVSSSLRRAVATAQVISGTFDVVADLDEFRFGDAAPASRELAVQRADLALWRPEHGFPGGETLRAFEHRVAGVLERLAAQRTGRRTVVVTHSGVIDAGLRWAFGVPPEEAWIAEVSLPHASITELEHWPGGRRSDGAPRFSLLHRIGDVTHLLPGLVTGR